jgi:YD repeat-containing protein
MFRGLSVLGLGLALATAAAAQPVALSCGTPVTGSFTQGNANADFYTVPAQAGDVILVRLLAPNPPQGFAPRIVVADLNNRPVAGTQVSSNGATLAALYTLVNGGSYGLQVLNVNATPGASYMLAFTYLNRACTGGLTCGAGLQSAFTPFGIQSFQFAANAGDVVSVRWTRVAPYTTTTLPNGSQVSFTPLVSVFDSTGTLLATTTGAGASVLATAGRMDVPVVAAGMVNVVAFDYNSLSGTLALSATPLNRPCGADALSCGAVTTSAVAAALNVQTFAVAMNSGDTGVIRAVPCGNGSCTTAAGAGSLAPALELYDPKGNRVAAAVSSGGAVSLPFQAQSGGTYTLLLSDRAGTGTGYAATTLLRFNRPCSGAGTLSCSSVADGSISGFLNTNLYTLTAAANDVYLLRLVGTGSNPLFRPRVDLYDVQGNVAGTLAVANFKATVRFTAAGTYTAVVSDGYDGTQSGTYGLSTTRLNGACTTATLNCGAVAQGTITRPLDAGVYRYSAAAGESFSVRMLNPGATLQPDLEIYDPTGNPAGQAVSANYTGVDVVNPAGGAYTVLAMDKSKHGGGTYALDLLRTVNACAATPAEGQTVAATVTATVPFASYSVPAAAGDALLMRSASTTPGFSAQMELYDPTGARVDSETYALTRTAAAGNYTVIVGASAPGTGGGYTLSWQALNRPAGTQPLACGKSANGPLAPASQFQYYAVAANTGDVLRLLLTKLSDNFSPQLDVYDPTGARVASALDITATAAAAGNYLVMVSPSSSNAENGTYALTFQRPNNPCSATALTCGQTALRQVTVPAQMDAYTFSGTGGDRADIKLTQRSGGYAPYGELYDANGKRLAAGASGALVANLPAGGTYTVLVRDTRGTTLGSYRIGVQDDTSACTVTDTQPPTVTLLAPTGGEVLGGGTAYLIQWQSDDNVGVTGHTIALSTDGGQTFPATIASGIGGNTQSYLWQVPPNIAPTRTAVVRVTATDAAGNTGPAASGPVTLVGTGFTPNSTAQYGYDGLNRMVQATLSDGRTITYTYDAAGNLVAVAVSH